MSWPTDGLPRFKVTSCIGRSAAYAYVLDRAHCHLIVSEHLMSKNYPSRAVRAAEARARELAAAHADEQPVAA